MDSHFALIPSHMPATAADCIRRSARKAPLLAALVTAAWIGGCTTITKPFEDYIPLITQFGVYKLDVNQGNFISQDMVDKLKVGQTKQQVRTNLGTPLIMSVFRENRWDYMYEFRRAGRLREHRQFTVFFTDDQLARWEGDEMPQSVQDLNRAAASRAMPDDPYGQDGGVIGKVIDFFRKIVDPTASPTP